MGKGRAPESTKSAIIEAAGTLFSEKGFSGVTAREVVKAAGVALSAIPYHFGSMEELYRESLLTACQVAPDAVAWGEQAKTLGPAEGLRAAVRWALVDATTTSSWQMRLVMREELDPSPIFKEVLRLKVEPEWRWLCEVVARATELEADSNAVKFGVILMYSVTSSFHMDRGIVQHLAPEVGASVLRQPDEYVECMANLTVDAVQRYAKKLSKKSGPGSRKATEQDRYKKSGSRSRHQRRG